MTQNPPTGDSQHGDWNQVGAAFTALGEKIQAHFSGLTPKAPAAESAAPFEELGRSLDDALTAFRNAVGDPDIADAAKGAADDLMAALRTEVDSAGETASGALDQVSGKIDEIANAGKDAAGDPTPDKELPHSDGPVPPSS